MPNKHTHTPQHLGPAPVQPMPLELTQGTRPMQPAQLEPKLHNQLANTSASSITLTKLPIVCLSSMLHFKFVTHLGWYYNPESVGSDIVQLFRLI